MRQLTRGGRGIGAAALTIFVFVLVAMAVVPVAAASTSTTATTAFVPAPLLEAAQANPSSTFRVIIQGRRGVSSNGVGGSVALEQLETPGNAIGVKRRFSAINGTAADVTGRQLVKLAQRGEILAITRDVPVRLSNLSTRQQWPHVAGITRGWPTITNGSIPNLPAIAIVDSGIDATRPDFGGRVRAQVNLTSLSGNSPGDGRGHGTFVAGIAAGQAHGFAGAAPSAPIVSIDVMNDQGMALTSDVIAAADWILQNRALYNIRVANFSLHTTAPASVFSDPLGRAVQRLWFSGVVVVTSSGNYGVNGQPSGVLYSPGHDPFVITVGANDIGGSVSTNDDTAAPWSSYGYTYDGFAKPEIAAPGRYMVGPVPPTSTLALERPGSMVAPGYIQLSGTSFATAAVSGAAAYLLGLNPHWTPDQVKGALMLSARPTPSATPRSNGVGVIDLAKAALVTNPPNPNLALSPFVVPDPAGGTVPVFDSASWASTALANASWASASWASASWASASWASASWASASWATASWASASWASASWASASWASTTVPNGADGDVLADGAYWLDEEQEALLEAEFGIRVEADGSVTLVDDAAPIELDSLTVLETSLSTETELTTDITLSTDASLSTDTSTTTSTTTSLTTSTGISLR